MTQRTFLMVLYGIVKVETSGLHMEERRTAIELLAVKERLQQGRCLSQVGQWGSGTCGWAYQGLET